ncbi:DNA polymerase IV [Pedobacter heparinus]|uniref:DNA polymerase IV n=1 Tax=Pedobacter heparinus (strain ATCC 13125 / DSM 2366 / CIP 104194 / JCM 7457 / NBRC 12017 / NCIMB 9290 / NRRL B-14731 / HIM 762-3) TaxID=485917 RepID=C6XT23_PEDHD|nr:DNA polymerase IV [Pedobacter heparinus]ACU03584.1 DNA-directed DNA polymerase [Pedobacter heparinus DSM 2366]
MSSDKHIIHMDLDSFFVSVEIKKNSKLAGKPVIVGGLSDRGVVTSCSYEARKYGVHSAMPSRLARQLCPHAEFVRGNMDDYSEHSRMVTEILQQKVPVLEKASIDEHYIDMTGMERFYGCMKFARELKEQVFKESGLPVSFGLSVNKTVSKIATNECKPNGALQVEQLEIPSFLNPLSIKKIPGLGAATFLKLSEMGVRKIHTFAQIPQQQVYKVLGNNGLSLWQKAHGIDHTPVIPYREQKSISKQQTFESDSIDFTQIRQLITGMVIELAYELRKQQKLTACVTIVIRYSNFETITQQCRIPYTALDDTLIVKAKELFERAYTRRMLIRLVGIKLSALVNGYEQIDLYSASEEKYNLYQAMDKIRNRYGEKAIALASTLSIKL